MLVILRRVLVLLPLIVAAPPSRATEGVPPVIPIDTFFAGDAVRKPTLSPTGRYLAWLQPVHDRANLMILDRQTGKKTRLTDMKADYISEFDWLTPDRLVFSKRALEETAVGTFAVNADGSQLVSLRDDKYTNSHDFDLIDPWAADSKHILIEVERGSSALTEPYSVDIYTGKATKLLGNTNNLRRWITDRRGVLRLAVGFDDIQDLTVVYYRENADAAWIEIERFPTHGPSWVPLGFDGDNRTLWIRSNRGRDTEAIYTYDPVTRKNLREVLADPVYDADGIVYSRRAGKVIGLTIDREKNETEWLDEPNRQVVRAIEQALPDTQNSIVSRAHDDSAFVILARSDRDPGTYFLFDNREQSLTRLYQAKDHIVAAQMAAMKPVTIEARDGLMLHGYLTLPVGRGPQHLPLVVFPHDDAYNSRDSWGFRPEVQFFANRGYAVLQVNYRGSLGYGVRFQEAGFHQWGLKMQDDLSDAVKWAIAQGTADPKRIAIYGTYYGGFAALVGLTKTPELYACGVSREGPVDLHELSVMQRLTAQDPAYQDYVVRYWGHPGRDAEQLKSASPIYSIANLRAPLLTAYRKFDPDHPRLIYDDYLRLEKELKKHGKAHRNVFIENKEPGYNESENWLGFYRELDAFLAECFRSGTP